MDGKLTLKQRRFIKAYIQTGNATWGRPKMLDISVKRKRLMRKWAARLLERLRTRYAKS